MKNLMEKMILVGILTIFVPLMSLAQSSAPPWINNQGKAWEEAAGSETYIYAVGLNSGYTKDLSENELLKHHQEAIGNSLAKMKDLLGVNSVNGFQLISTWYDATTIYFLGACPEALNKPKKEATMIPPPSAQKPSGQKNNDTELLDLWSPESPGLKEGNTTLEDALTKAGIQTLPSLPKKWWKDYQPMSGNDLQAADFIKNTFIFDGYLYAIGRKMTPEGGNNLSRQQDTVVTQARGVARRCLYWAVQETMINAKGKGTYDDYNETVKTIIGYNGPVEEVSKPHWEDSTSYVLLRLPLNAIEKAIK